MVRNIANHLTNQLYLAEEHQPGCVDLNQAHMAGKSCGGRDWEGTGHTRGGEYWWQAFGEEEVERLWWSSASSGNALEAKKIAPGEWMLQYFLGTDPKYRGSYYGMYENPEAVQNARPEYVYQYTRKLSTDGEWRVK